jgi:hypothetical protein
MHLRLAGLTTFDIIQLKLSRREINSQNGLGVNNLATGTNMAKKWIDPLLRIAFD